MRKIQVIGNVTRDAEVRTLDGGRSVINFDLACNEKYKDKNGEKKVKVYYIKCAIWRDNTSIAQYITKGSKIYVEGQPDIDCYVNKDTGKAVGSVKINVREVEFLGGGKNQQQSGQSSVPSNDDSFIPESNDGSDLPF
jgi:single-strand DNA-binding protein